MNVFQRRKINREENLAKNKVLKKPCWRFSQFHWRFRTHLALRDLWDTLRDSKTECKSWASRKYIPVFLIYFPLCANISFLEETLAQGLVRSDLNMAEASEKRTRRIAMAVDQSEWSEQAFECE